MKGIPGERGGPGGFRARPTNRFYGWQAGPTRVFDRRPIRPAGPENPASGPEKAAATLKTS
jgi:hypothetical protein